VNLILSAEDTTRYEEYAEKLATIGVFKGTPAGFELDRQPTRLEGLVMLIRLLGKEDEALSIKDEASVFTDVPDWGIPFTNYAFKNGLTKGLGNGLFGSKQTLDAKSFYTFVLRALGYSEIEGDFVWSEASNVALSKNILSDETYKEIQTSLFKRGHVAQSSYNALFSKIKNSDKTLLETLVLSGDINDLKAKELDQGSSAVQIIALDKYAEYVKIQNKGLLTVDIGGWTMVSEKGSQIFVFPIGYKLASNQICALTSGDLKYTGDFTMDVTTIWNNFEPDDAVLLDGKGVEVNRWVDGK